MHPILIILATVAIALFLLGNVMFLRSGKARKRKHIEKPEADKLILLVDLKNINVVDNKYFVENDKYYYSKTPLVDFMIDGQNPEQYNEINQCRFEYTAVYNNETLTFVSQVINKDRETLMFKLFAQKQTKLYLNKNDYSDHYLDLEFLDV